MHRRISHFVGLSCLIVTMSAQTSCQSSRMLKSEKHVSDAAIEIPFELTEGNNIKFQAVLNEVDSIDLFFDTGGTEIVMKQTAIKNCPTLMDGRNPNYIEGGNMPLETLNSLSIGDMKWDSLMVFPTRVGPSETSGHFGWNLFEGKIVELNYDEMIMTVHSNLPDNSKDYVKLDVEYTHTLFCVQGQLRIGDAQYTNRYLFDTGFQRSIILDKDLREKNAFPNDLPVIKESKLRNGAGKVFVNKVVLADDICFDDVCLSDVPVQLLSTPNPARFETHILGNELLKRYNTILDFKDHHVYLKQNGLVGEPYSDKL